MTQEDKRNIAHILRCETGCGMMEVTTAIEKLIEALKNKPLTVMDNPPKININWEDQNTENNNLYVKWEYKEVIISPINDNTNELNEFGEQGWEMCGYDGKYGVAVFKRTKK